MRDFQRLRLIRFVRELIVLTYRTTDQFPRSEQFGLTSQMRRAAIAIGSNIAEGCGRSSNRAYRVSLDRAMGEGSELEFQCLVAQDLGLGSPSAVDHLLKETIRVKKMLARLIVFIRGQQTPSDEGRTPPRAREPESPRAREPREPESPERPRAPSAREPREPESPESPESPRAREPESPRAQEPESPSAHLAT